MDVVGGFRRLLGMQLGLVRMRRQQADWLSYSGESR